MARNLQLIPKVLDGVEIRALCGPVNFFHTMHSHAGIERVLSQTVSLEAWHCPLSWYAAAL